MTDEMSIEEIGRCINNFNVLYTFLTELSLSSCSQVIVIEGKSNVDCVF